MTQVGDRVRIPDTAFAQITRAKAAVEQSSAMAQVLIDGVLLGLGMAPGEYSVRLDEKTQEFVVEAKE